MAKDSNISINSNILPELPISEGPQPKEHLIRNSKSMSILQTQKTIVTEHVKQIKKISSLTRLTPKQNSMPKIGQQKSLAVLKAVQGGRSTEKPPSDKEDLQVFIELFEENGHINLAKLEATIEYLGYEHYLIKIKRMLRDISNGKGLLPIKDFLELWNKKWDVNVEPSDYDFLFSKYDYNKKGDINATKLGVVASDLEIPITEQETADMIKYFTSNKTSMNKTEFIEKTVKPDLR